MWVILSPAWAIKGEDFVCSLAPCFTYPFYSVFVGGEQPTPCP